MCCCWACWQPWHKVRCGCRHLALCGWVSRPGSFHQGGCGCHSTLHAARRHLITPWPGWTARSEYSGNGVKLLPAGQPSLGTGEDALDPGVFGDEAALSDAPLTPPAQLPVASIAERARQVRAWPCESWPALRVAASCAASVLDGPQGRTQNTLHLTQGPTRRRPLWTRRTSACRPSRRPGPPRPAQRPHPDLRPSPVRSAQRGAAAGCCLWVWPEDGL